jgi:hypothetical protein
MSLWAPTIREKQEAARLAKRIRGYPIGLFDDVKAVAPRIPRNVEQCFTIGRASAGDGGGAPFYPDLTVTVITVLLWPNTTFVDSYGRGWRARPDEFTLEMAAGVGDYISANDVGTDNLAAIVALMDEVDEDRPLVIRLQDSGRYYFSDTIFPNRYISLKGAGGHSSTKAQTFTAAGKPFIWLNDDGGSYSYLDNFYIGSAGDGRNNAARLLEYNATTGNILYQIPAATILLAAGDYDARTCETPTIPQGRVTLGTSTAPQTSRAIIYTAGLGTFSVADSVIGGTSTTESTILSVVTGHVISISAASGSFLVGETVTGGTSGKTAVVTAIASGFLAVTSASGNFTVAETITGGTSGKTATVSAFAAGGYITSKDATGSYTVAETIANAGATHTGTIKATSTLAERYIDCAGLSGTFTVGETVTGDVSGASATVAEVSGTTITLTNLVLGVNLLDFIAPDPDLGTPGEGITGGSSAATATISAYGTTGTRYVGYWQLDLHGGSGWADSETVTGGTSGAVGKIFYRSASFAQLILNSCSKAFTVGETITGATSGTTAVIHETSTVPAIIRKAAASSVYASIRIRGATTTGTVSFTGDTGTFLVGRIIRGATSRNTATITGVAAGSLTVQFATGPFTIGETITQTTGPSAGSATASSSGWWTAGQTIHGATSGTNRTIVAVDGEALLVTGSGTFTSNEVINATSGDTTVAGHFFIASTVGANDTMGENYNLLTPVGKYASAIVAARRFTASRLTIFGWNGCASTSTPAAAARPTTGSTTSPTPTTSSSAGSTHPTAAWASCARVATSTPARSSSATRPTSLASASTTADSSGRTSTRATRRRRCAEDTGRAGTPIARPTSRAITTRARPAADCTSSRSTSSPERRARNIRRPAMAGSEGAIRRRSGAAASSRKWARAPPTRTRSSTRRRRR